MCEDQLLIENPRSAGEQIAILTYQIEAMLRRIELRSCLEYRNLDSLDWWEKKCGNSVRSYYYGGAD